MSPTVPRPHPKLSSPRLQLDSELGRSHTCRKLVNFRWWGMATIAVDRTSRSPCGILGVPPRRRPDCCLPLDNVEVRKPDPSTFDQRKLLSMGIPISFNNHR